VFGGHNHKDVKVCFECKIMKCEQTIFRNRLLIITLASFGAVLLFAIPFVAKAQVPCPPDRKLADCIKEFNEGVGGEKGAGYDTSGEFGKASNITDYVKPIVQGALALVGTLFFLYMFYGGYLWFSAAGNDERLKQGQEVIRNSIIGLIIVIGAYAITAFVLSRLLG